MKTEVYSWRLSAERKAQLEEEARRRSTSVANILEQITSEWFADHANGRSDDEAEQAALRRRVMATVGTIRGGDPSRSERASELVREIIHQKHRKESDAFRRRTD